MHLQMSLYKLPLTLSAPSFPPSCSLMSGDNVDVAQSVFPTLSSITCEKTPASRHELLQHQIEWPEQGASSLTITKSGLLSAPERRYAGLICILQGAVSLAVPESACQC